MVVPVWAQKVKRCPLETEHQPDECDAHRVCKAESHCELTTQTECLLVIAGSHCCLTGESVKEQIRLEHPVEKLI